MPSFGTRPEHLLETIFDQVRIAVLVVNDERRIVYANDPALQVLGISRTAIAGPLPMQDLPSGYRFFDSRGHEVPREQLPLFHALAGETVEPYNTKLGLPNGSFRWLHVTAHHFSVLGLDGAILVATDETREVELQRIAGNIQKVELLSAMAGALAHNFNNILEVISLSAQACLDSPDVGPASRARLQQIVDASHHASDLTKRLAQFSRTQEIKPRSISINQLIRSALALIEPLMFSKIQVIRKLHPDLPEVEVDPVQVEQVLFNLILNARDAMPNGGQLIIATDLGNLPSEAATGSDGKQCVTITVSDTGSGISEENLDRIFEPFFTTKPKGTGLGLASAQGIARQHGGDVTVQSVSGKGAQFTVYLPPSQTRALAPDQSTRLDPQRKLS